MGELALCFEMVASFYMCQPNHSYSHFMFSLHSDLTCVTVVADVMHCIWSELPPPREYPTVLFIGLWPHSFHKIMYLYSICLVSTMCCDATITKYKLIQELRTLLKTFSQILHVRKQLQKFSPSNLVHNKYKKWLEATSLFTEILFFSRKW